MPKPQLRRLQSGMNSSPMPSFLFRLPRIIGLNRLFHQESWNVNPIIKVKTPTKVTMPIPMIFQEFIPELACDALLAVCFGVSLSVDVALSVGASAEVAEVKLGRTVSSLTGPEMLLDVIVAVLELTVELDIDACWSVLVSALEDTYEEVDGEFSLDRDSSGWLPPRNPNGSNAYTSAE